jgi:hypothetical protein
MKWIILCLLFVGCESATLIDKTFVLEVHYTSGTIDTLSHSLNYKKGYDPSPILTRSGCIRCYGEYIACNVQRFKIIGYDVD